MMNLKTVKSIKVCGKGVYRVRLNDNTVWEFRDGKSVEIPIHIPNDTGSIIENATIRLALHKGSQEGDAVYNEIFSEDFGMEMGDICLLDSNGNRCDYYIQSYGNYDFIKDAKLDSEYGVHSFSDGTLAKTYNGQICYSTDNANTWVDTGITAIGIAFIDSHDRMFVKASKQTCDMYDRSFNKLGTPADFTGMGADISFVQQRFAEGRDGTIYLAKYQSEQISAGIGASIWRMKYGESTFTKVYEDLKRQHTHRIAVDKTGETDIIYAGIDYASGIPDIVMSKDHGETWESLPACQKAVDQGYFAFHNGKSFGGGEANVLGGYSLFASDDVTDASSFRGVINTNQLIRRVDFVDDRAFAYGACCKTNHIEQIFYSEDGGDTWVTAYADDYRYRENDVGSGNNSYSTGYILPKGADEKQIIVTGNNVNYGLRCYVGGDRYYSLIYANVGEIPAEGKDIVLKTGKQIYSPNFEGTVTSIGYSPIVEAALDEGTGNIVSVNSTSTAICGDYEWKKWTDKTRVALAEKSGIEKSAVVLNNGYIPVGKIALNRLTGVTIAFTIGSMSWFNNGIPGVTYTILDSDNLKIRLGKCKTNSLWGQSLYVDVKNKADDDFRTYRLYGISPTFYGSNINQMVDVVIVIDEKTIRGYSCGEMMNDTGSLVGTASDTSGIANETMTWADAGDFVIGSKKDVGVPSGLCNLKIYDRVYSATA